MHKAALLPLEYFMHNTPQAQELCQAADVIVLHRYLYEASLASIARWHARGKRILVDVDAAIEFIEPDRAGFDFWKRGILPESLQNGRQPISPPPLDQLKWLMKMVDAVLVPTPSLAHDLFAYGRVSIVPDFLNINEYLVVRPARDEVRIRVGINYSGMTPSSLRASGVLEGLQQAAERCDRLHLLLAGDAEIPGDPFPQLPEWRKTIIAPVPHVALPGVLAGVDIGLAAAAGDFERRQSPLRVLEYMAMKIPWIASNLHCYQSMVSYGILVDNSPDAWAEAILALASRIDTAQRRASGAAYLHALSQDAAENLDKIVRVLQPVAEEVV